MCTPPRHPPSASLLRLLSRSNTFAASHCHAHALCLPIYLSIYLSLAGCLLCRCCLSVMCMVDHVPWFFLLLACRMLWISCVPRCRATSPCRWTRVASGAATTSMPSGVCVCLSVSVSLFVSHRPLPAHASTSASQPHVTIMLTAAMVSCICLPRPSLSRLSVSNIFVCYVDYIDWKC